MKRRKIFVSVNFGAMAIIVQGILVLVIVAVVIFLWPDNKISGVNTGTIGLHNDILADHEARIKELEGR